MFIIRADVLNRDRADQEWEYERVWLCAEHSQHGFGYRCTLPGSAALDPEQARTLIKRLRLPEKGDENLLRVWVVDTRQ
jgi:hypothetical protein